MDTVKLFELVFKGSTAQKQVKEELRMEDQQFTEFLRERELTERYAISELRWMLHQSIDESVPLVDDVDDLYLIAHTVTRHLNNKKPKLGMTEEIARQLLLLQFKSPTERRAYIELCEGEMTTYKIYMPNDASLFTHYLIKAMMCSDAFNKFRNNPALFIKVANYTLYKVLGVKGKHVEQELNKLGIFRKRKNPKTEIVEPVIDFHATRYIRKYFSQNKAPYVQGYTRIFEQLLGNAKEEIQHQQLYPFFEFYSEEGRKTIEKRRIEANEGRKNNKAPQEKAAEEIMKLQEAPATESQIEEVLESQASASQELLELQERFELAHEEIQRLERELEQQRQQTKNVASQAIENVFKKLGSAQMNYLLSDLYRVSYGESDMTPTMIEGLLMNLFEGLTNDLDLTPFGNGFNIGDTFEIERTELASTYRALHQIKSTEPTLKVELIQYGWQLQRKTIVQPLVNEKLEV